MTDIMNRMTDDHEGRNLHDGRVWMPSMMTVLAIAVPILFIAGGLGLSYWYTHRTADTSHVIYAYSRSAKFNKAQLDAAGHKTAEVFSGFSGCTIERIAYDETQADKLLDLEDESKADHRPTGRRSTMPTTGTAATASSSPPSTSPATAVTRRSAPANNR